MKTRAVQLGDVCERVDYGFTASADFSIKEPRFLRITDIQNGAVDWLTVPGCIINPNDESANGLQTGDIVIARTGATTGKAFLIRHAPRAVFASYLIRLRCSGDVLPEYLDAFFQCEPYWSQVRNSMRGAAQAGVNATMLGELRVPLPPLSEQQRIAGVLEQADRLRRTRRYALELSDSFLPAAFRQLFGDRQECQVASLGDIASRVVVGHVGETTEFYRTNGVAFLRTQNVRPMSINRDGMRYISQELVQKIGKTQLRRDDVLVSRVGANRGMAAVVPADLDGAYCANVLIVSPGASLVSDYLAFLVNSELGQKQLVDESVGSAQGVINTSALQAWRIPIPPLALQQQFASLVSLHERLRAVQRESLRQAEHLFQSLLHRAFTTGL